MIILDDKYSIDANENCYLLQTRAESKTKDGTPKKDEDGKPVMAYKTVGYYIGLHDAFRAWYNELLMSKVREDTGDAAYFSKEIRQIYKMVCATLDREIPKLSK